MEREAREMPLYLERSYLEHCLYTYNVVELPNKYWSKKATYTQVITLLIAEELTLGCTRGLVANPL